MALWYDPKVWWFMNKTADISIELLLTSTSASQDDCLFYLYSYYVFNFCFSLAIMEKVRNTLRNYDVISYCFTLKVIEFMVPCGKLTWGFLHWMIMRSFSKLCFYVCRWYLIWRSNILSSYFFCRIIHNLTNSPLLLSFRKQLFLSVFSQQILISITVV